MSIDAVGNFLTVMRNGLMARKRNVRVPSSTLKESIANLLKAEGYIKDFAVETDADGIKKTLVVHLKYVAGEPAIHEITRISRPGRRHYERLNGLTTVIGGLGVSILTTSAGVITDRTAREKNVGGEVLCHVW